MVCKIQWDFAKTHQNVHLQWYYVANLETNPSGTQLREKSSVSICPSSLDSFNYDIILENHLGKIYKKSDFGIRLNHYWCSLYCHWISPLRSAVHSNHFLFVWEIFHIDRHCNSLFTPLMSYSSQLKYEISWLVCAHAVNASGLSLIPT